MKKYILKALVGFCLFLSPVAHAYDADTHFYGTYAMARFAGIRHEIAAKIATGTQWMDESYISDPLSMIILPDVGIKKRRLLHFPGARIANKLTVSTLPSFLDPSSKVPLKTFTETEADHEFATEMFTEGLMSGNLMMASAGIHTLEDSFAHAGTIAELGHAHFWHHPDRPYVDDASVEKYFKMSRAVLKAMVAIRSLLPANGYDTTVKFGDRPNYQLNGDQLADIYTQLPDVRRTVSKKILNDPTFVKFALEDVFARAQKVNYVKNGYQNYLNKFTPGQDTYQAAGSIAKSLPPELVNIAGIMHDSGRPNLSSDYVLSMGGMGELLMRVVTDLLSGIVPRPMDIYHRFEKEEDGPVWVEENKLRVAGMRSLIKRMYNIDVFFVGNHMKGAQGFLKEMTKEPIAQINMDNAKKANPNINFVTFNLEEKYQFNRMIFNFLFPKLSASMAGNEKQLNAMAQLAVSAQDGAASDQSLMQKASGAWTNLKNLFNGPVMDLREKYRLAREDVQTAHIIPHMNNKFYAVPVLLQKEINTKVFKPLMRNEQIESLLKDELLPFDESALRSIDLNE
jgi:hypothetical protein